jgi:hemerythrin superfamily protein
MSRILSGLTTHQRETIMALVNRESTAEKRVQSPDAIALLKADHKKVSDLFEDFEAAGGTRKKFIASQICTELHAHAQIEEEIFYPAARSVLRGDDLALVEEADVEHASIKGLVGRIESATLSDAHFDAFVKVLGEYVKHHVKEEERELFPKLKDTQLDLKAVGAELAKRKGELQA